MYLAMARVAEREGYPEIAEAYKRYAYEEADHASQMYIRDRANCLAEMKYGSEVKAVGTVAHSFIAVSYTHLFRI